MTTKDRLMKIAAAAELRGLDGISARIAHALREMTAASSRLAGKESNIEVESWPDFLNWWNNNRGQNLVYIFMDTYGTDSKQVALVKKMVRDAEKHEKDLHEFYRTLRDQASRSMDMDPNKPEADLSASDTSDTSVDELPDVDNEAETPDESLEDIALDLND